MSLSTALFLVIFVAMIAMHLRGHGGAHSGHGTHGGCGAHGRRPRPQPTDDHTPARGDAHV